MDDELLELFAAYVKNKQSGQLLDAEIEAGMKKLTSEDTMRINALVGATTKPPSPAAKKTRPFVPEQPPEDHIIEYSSNDESVTPITLPLKRLAKIPLTHNSAAPRRPKKMLRMLGAVDSAKLLELENESKRLQEMIRLIEQQDLVTTQSADNVPKPLVKPALADRIGDKNSPSSSSRVDPSKLQNASGHLNTLTTHLDIVHRTLTQRQENFHQAKQKSTQCSQELIAIKQAAKKKRLEVKVLQKIEASTLAELRATEENWRRVHQEWENVRNYCEDQSLNHVAEAPNALILEPIDLIPTPVDYDEQGPPILFICSHDLIDVMRQQLEQPTEAVKHDVIELLGNDSEDLVDSDENSIDNDVRSVEATDAVTSQSMPVGAPEEIMDESEDTLILTEAVAVPFCERISFQQIMDTPSLRLIIRQAYYPYLADEVLTLAEFIRKISDTIAPLKEEYSVDPAKPFCYFETDGGTCSDASCKFQHFSDVFDKKALEVKKVARPKLVTAPIALKYPCWFPEVLDCILGSSDPKKLKQNPKNYNTESKLGVAKMAALSALRGGHVGNETLICRVDEAIEICKGALLISPPQIGEIQLSDMQNLILEMTVVRLCLMIKEAPTAGFSKLISTSVTSLTSQVYSWIAENGRDMTRSAQENLSRAPQFMMRLLVLVYSELPKYVCGLHRHQSPEENQNFIKVFKTIQLGVSEMCGDYSQFYREVVDFGLTVPDEYNHMIHLRWAFELFSLFQDRSALESEEKLQNLLVGFSIKSLLANDGDDLSETKFGENLIDQLHAILTDLAYPVKPQSSYGPTKFSVDRWVSCWIQVFSAILDSQSFATTFPAFLSSSISCTWKHHNSQPVDIFVLRLDSAKVSEPIALQVLGMLHSILRIVIGFWIDHSPSPEFSTPCYHSVFALVRNLIEVGSICNFSAKDVIQHAELRKISSHVFADWPAMLRLVASKKRKHTLPFPLELKKVGAEDTIKLVCTLLFADENVEQLDAVTIDRMGNISKHLKLYRELVGIRGTFEDLESLKFLTYCYAHVLAMKLDGKDAALGSFGNDVPSLAETLGKLLQTPPPQFTNQELDFNTILVQKLKT